MPNKNFKGVSDKVLETATFSHETANRLPDFFSDLREFFLETDEAVVRQFSWTLLSHAAKDSSLNSDSRFVLTSAVKFVQDIVSRCQSIFNTWQSEKTLRLNHDLLCLITLVKENSICYSTGDEINEDLWQLLISYMSTSEGTCGESRHDMVKAVEEIQILMYALYRFVNH